MMPGSCQRRGDYYHQRHYTRLIARTGVPESEFGPAGSGPATRDHRELRYRWVVCMELCWRSSCASRRSAPARTSSVPYQCRSECGVPGIPARRIALEITDETEDRCTGPSLLSALPTYVVNHKALRGYHCA
jgi:hypothetical protein